MKKTLFTFIGLFLAFGMANAQDGEELVLQPTRVIARKIIHSNQVNIVQEKESYFHYDQDGKLSGYDFPDYALSAGFFYSDDYLCQEYISHEGGYPSYHESNLYTYENGRIKTASHIVDNMGSCVYLVYDYYEDGRLESKERTEDDMDDFHEFWHYDYEDGGLTVVETYSTSSSSGAFQGQQRLGKRTTSRYDEGYNLSSELVERFDVWSGALTSVDSTDCVYTPSGMLETKTTRRLLGDGTWANTAVTQFVYDASDQIAEQLDGTWDDEGGGWNYTRKIVFENSEDGTVRTVSFYKNYGGTWVWDTFQGQTILFEPYLKSQQGMLYYLEYEGLNGWGDFNQLEFALEYTQLPKYTSTGNVGESVSVVYPNPTEGQFTVQGEGIRQVEVHNTHGQCILTQLAGGNSLTIDLSGQPAGIYFIKVTDKDGRKCVKKMVKQ